MTRSALPPRFVPTLTEIVQAPAAQPAAANKPLETAIDLQRLQEQMVLRVMQRVDLTLDQLLRETVGRLVLTHIQALAPGLRDEIEMVVRQSVNQALEKELAGQLLNQG